MSNSILLGIVIGFLKALRDTIAHHWDNCIFRYLSPEWLCRFTKSAWDDVFFRIDVLGIPIKFDAWHVLDWLILGAMFTWAVREAKVRHFIAFAVSSGLTFVLFYHKLLLV